MKVIKEYGIAFKVGYFRMGNAENNDGIPSVQFTISAVEGSSSGTRFG